ncbi:MAG: 1-deoxy-D-xylulose-5-phosphate reductoisomerase, partial [Halioglobus sp.]
MSNSPRQVSVLGSTGSIGVSTLDVIARHPAEFSVYALAANRSVDAMLAQCLQHQPQFAVMMDESSAHLLEEKLPAECQTQVLQGEEGLTRVVTAPEVDSV